MHTSWTLMMKANTRKFNENGSSSEQGGGYQVIVRHLSSNHIQCTTLHEVHPYNFSLSYCTEDRDKRVRITCRPISAKVNPTSSKFWYTLLASHEHPTTYDQRRPTLRHFRLLYITTTGLDNSATTTASIGYRNLVGGQRSCGEQ